MAVIICILMDSPIIRFKAVIPIAKFRFFSKKFTATVRGIRFCKFGPAIARTTIYAVKNCHNDWLLEKYIVPNPTTSEAKNIIHLGPDPEPRQIDQKTRVETARYLLQVRKAYLKEDYDAAITALRRAIELNPFSSQAFAMLGSVYYRLGWNRMAIENWQHSLELDPTNEGLKKYLMRLSR